MYTFSDLTQVLKKLEQSGLAKHLKYINHGLEKEALRQNAEGFLSQIDHPKALGSTLTNSYITTDYSEALVEFITPVFKDSDELLKFLFQLHAFSSRHLPQGESFWCHSMPCILTEEQDIPIARYGTSNIGRMKHVYRHGLAWRYTRRMQTIAGIHFNFSYPDSMWKFLYEQSTSELSLQDYKSTRYFDLVRNFQRSSYLLFYLFGASPALCKSFLDDQQHDLESFDECTAYLPYATSLRMSDLGYTNKEQQALAISFNSLEEYVSGMERAIKTSSDEFESIGVKVDGEYRQLNSNILQIENEFYSIVRPKRTANSGETPSAALKDRGVEYIEIRMLDINPFDEVGINAQQMDFLDIFMLACLIQESPAIDAEENKLIHENQHRVIHQGRKPGLNLLTTNGERGFREMGLELCESLKSSAALLDNAMETRRFSESLIYYSSHIENPEETPSGKILKTLKEEHISYYNFAKEISGSHNEKFVNSELDEELKLQFSKEAERSLLLQKEIEGNDTLSFDDFLSNYFSQQS